MATNIKMNKNMISWSIFFIILIFGISDFAVEAPENVELAVKFYDKTATQSTYNSSFLVNYTSERNWYCIINNRTRFVTVIKRKFMSRRLLYYANCNSSFNPTVSSLFLLQIRTLIHVAVINTTQTDHGITSRTCIVCI